MSSMQTRLVPTTFLFLFLACACLLSCTNATPEKTIEVLKQRAGEYWGYRINNEQEKAFAYESPQSLDGITLSEYRTRLGAGVTWLGAEPEKVVLKGDEAAVYMKIRYLWTFTEHQPKSGFENTYVDRWKFQDGTWYHVYRKPVMTPPQQLPKAEPLKAEEQPAATAEQPTTKEPPANTEQPADVQQPGHTEKQ